MLQSDGVAISKVLSSLFTVIHNIDLKSIHESLMKKNNKIKPKMNHLIDCSSIIDDCFGKSLPDFEEK